MVNGHNIHTMIKMAIKAYEGQKYEAFGMILGRASERILSAGHRHDHHGHHGHDRKDSTRFFDKMGGDFLSGFFFGARVGQFSEAEMEECLSSSPEDESIFEEADRLLKQAMHKQNYNIGLAGM